MARRSIEGSGRVRLAPGKVLNLVFLIRIGADADLDLLVNGRCVWALKDVEVATSDGNRVLTGPSGWVAGVKWGPEERELRGVC